MALALFVPVHQRRHVLIGAAQLMLHQAGDPDLDSITIEHNNLLLDRSCAEAARAACVAFLTSQGRAGQGGVGQDPVETGLRWDELYLGGVSSPEAFRPVADAAGLMVSYTNYSRSWAVELGPIRENGQSYLEGLRSNTRYQIRRAMRLYERRGQLTATPAASVAEAMDYFTHMKELHQRYWTGRGFRGSFASPFFERFHRALLTACLPQGTVELVRVSAGDVPIGYVYNLVHQGWVCAYQTGFVYEADAKLKPGLVSHYLCIMRHLELGSHRYDFLAGGDRYKASLARSGPDIGTMVLQRPLLRLRLENFARELKHDGLGSVLGLGAPHLEETPRKTAAWRLPGGADAGVGAAKAGAKVATPLAAPVPTLGRVPGKVLVLGDDTRSFLAITRSLGRQGIEVHAGPASFGSFALRSRYIRRVHYLPYSIGDGAEWLLAIETLLQAERFDLVIPCDETTLIPLQRNRARLETLTRLAIPGDRAIEVLFDKHATRELARSLGVPVSPGRLPRPDDTAAGVQAELGLPVVAKPRASYTTERLHARGKVRILETLDDLAEALPGLDPARFVYEGFVPGRGVGVSLLAHEGRVLQIFEHHRVRETVAGSYYRVSAALTPALVAEAEAIVAALDYTGVAMFEFRVSGDSHVLLEVNARPWGSMPLPVALGIDFPYFWYRLLVEGVEVPRVAYRTGVFGRNLVPDFWSTVSEVRQVARRPGAGARRGRAAGLFAGRMLELGRLFTGREVHDVLVRDDPSPGLRELWGTVADVVRRFGQRVPRPGLAARRRARAEAALLRALAAPPGPAAADTTEILFVCQGNICRSPFAEVALRSRLGAGSDVAVASSGMLPMPGRPTPGFGLAAAAARGLDLQKHRSRHLGWAEAEAATVIFIFDDINRRAILNRYPDLRTPLLRLGDFAPDAVASIDDPYGHSPAVYAETYDVIGAAVKRVAALIEASDGHGRGGAT